jgi:hypothetical protein
MEGGHVTVDDPEAAGYPLRVPRSDIRRTRRGRDLLVVRVLALAPVVLAFPMGSLVVFRLGADRAAVADAIAWVYSVGLFAAFTASFWPLPVSGSGAERRARSAALLFLVVVRHAPHLGTRLARADDASRPRETRHGPIRGGVHRRGDRRYATAPPELIAIESPWDQRALG